MIKHVFAICPTYTRPPARMNLLEDTVQCFLDQDHPNKTLVIINDCHAQHLYCDAENVRVINLPYRVNSLGDKYNQALDFITHMWADPGNDNYVCPWEDDDISLPWRMSLSLGLIEDKEYFNPQYGWYEESGKLIHTHGHGVCHNASMFKLSPFNRYAQTSGNQDHVFDLAMKRANKHSLKTLPNKSDWFYVYRWGVSDFHLSGFPNTEEAYKKGSAVEPVTGTFQIIPRKRQDYVWRTAEILEKEGLPIPRHRVS